MTKDEFEFILFDRIEKIKQINEQYDLENNAYISFSGGGDSTILHYLIDLALPNNKIPRLFINTGIEYNDIVDYVKELSKKDDRIIIYNSGVNIKEMLEKNGYPFKSKVFANVVEMYNRLGKVKSVKAFLGEEETKNGNIKKGQFRCPKNLRYIFEENNLKFKISHLCCYKLKKEPASIWAKENKRFITITGMRSSEGGARMNLRCLTMNNTKFNPLVTINDDFKNKFIEKYQIKLCKLYYAPYNFKRTGCKGCPFALDLQENLDIMRDLLFNEYKQCEKIWEPVYTEYRRINYRLKKTNQMSIFDFTD